MSTEIRITQVNDQYGWLHCMSAHKVADNNIIFGTTEALFQWKRFSNYPNVQKEILEQKSPMGAKMKARLNRAFLSRSEKWDESEADLPLMKKCMELKIQQHPSLSEKLIETENAIIIEDCTTHDRESARFWGSVKINGKWFGQNVLGKLWMEIRKELKT
ncbi:MAG: NADAR family protein [Ignavibacteriaceae bacterium]|nr:NADAR family protein [Ignavibacteriaceae bacterium]